MYYPRTYNSQIGTAWFGTHIVLIRCNYQTGDTLALFKSDHAPSEPAAATCAETLSRYISIGYTLIGAYPLNDSEVQYVLQYR
ncbi:hypothetical protein [Sutcliffiella horikoshii]|uniref:hypothetical protein n=1 Tax=Sutcliffiella horikoshii TaxID=79883 RepID=UPI001F41A095|nr:hypothetical protein [Sutcliffiella horikoshii]MCG1023146.1 hypothetical protein [Sutcliffiella horikoshii]